MYASLGREVAFVGLLLLVTVASAAVEGGAFGRIEWSSVASVEIVCLSLCSKALYSCSNALT